LSKASIQRNLNVIRAILNFTTRELGLDDIRAFSGIYLGDDPVTEPNKRLPIPANTILEIQNTCHRLDDEARWLIALISDTGMRLSEAVGLVKADIIRDCHTPYIRLREHSWRRLKTRNSERTIPLVGDALWAVKRASDTSSTSFLFPRYCDETTCKGNSASAALNKWLSPRVPSGCVIHSFRHSLRDRLRAVECPPDIIDRIGGWSVTGIGETYGTGYPIEVISDWMKKMVKP
jgi:integrase